MWRSMIMKSNWSKIFNKCIATIEKNPFTLGFAIIIGFIAFFLVKSYGKILITLTVLVYIMFETYNDNLQTKLKQDESLALQKWLELFNYIVQPALISMRDTSIAINLIEIYYVKPEIFYNNQVYYYDIPLKVGTHKLSNDEKSMLESIIYRRISHILEVKRSKVDSLLPFEVFDNSIAIKKTW